MFLFYIAKAVTDYYYYYYYNNCCTAPRKGQNIDKKKREGRVIGL
jgi:hypothetical protein